MMIKGNYLDDENVQHSTSDRIISISLMSPFVILSIQFFILNAFNLTSTIYTDLIMLSSKIVVGLFFLVALPRVFQRSRLKILVIYFIGFCVILYNYLVFPENHQVMESIIFPFFFMCLPAYIYCVSIENLKVLMSVMKETSYIVFIIGSLLSGLILSGFASLGYYSMSLSYYMLLPAIIFLNELISRVNVHNFLLASISIFIILALGARGPLLCIAVFIILRLLKPLEKLKISHVINLIFIFGIITLVAINIERILNALSNILSDFGLKSRSIRLFLSGDYHSSGRDVLYNELIYQIKNSPLLGIGIAGDRRVLPAAYAHNIILEILAHFGVVLGGILILILFFLVFRSLIMESNFNYTLLVVWISLGLTHLMVSSSYLIDLKFWIFLGILTKLIKLNMSSNENHYLRLQIESYK